MRRREQLINMFPTRQFVSLGCSCGLCDLKCDECFKLLLNLALNTLDLLLDLLRSLVPLKKLLGRPVVKWQSDLLLAGGSSGRQILIL